MSSRNPDDEADGEAVFEDDQFMGFHDARFILLTLAGWSRAHGVSRVVELAGEQVPPAVGPPDPLPQPSARSRALFHWLAAPARGLLPVRLRCIVFDDGGATPRRPSAAG